MLRPPHSALILTFALGSFTSVFAARLTDPLLAVLSLDFVADPARVALLAICFAQFYAGVQPALTGSRVLTGMAGGDVFPVTLALFGDRVPMAERHVATSRFLACAIAGQMAGGAAAGLLEPITGWRGLTVLCGLLSALSVIPVLRDRSPEKHGRLNLGLARGVIGLPAVLLLEACGLVALGIVMGRQKNIS